MADGNAPKRVFLRKVLYRMDFQFITEQVQEEIYSYIADKYGDYFSDLGCEQGHAVDIEIDPNLQGLSRFNSKPQSVYYLVCPKGAEKDGRTIKIGKTFIFLDIDLGIVSENLPYYTWFADIINYLKTKRLFRPTRIGLRKFNAFFILKNDVDNLNSIFSIPFFEKIEETSFEIDRFNSVQLYNSHDYSLNFTKEISTGLLNNSVIKDEVAHRISFDFDMFSDKQEVLNKFCANAQQGLEEMNGRIYKFFQKFVTDDVCEKINRGDLLEEYKVIIF